MGNFLNAYLQNTGFARWLYVVNKYTQVTDDNVAQYYTLYAHRQLCETKKCYECSGLYPTWTSEADIINNRIKTTTCIIREAEKRLQAGQAYASRLQIPPAYQGITLNVLKDVQPDVKDYLQQWVTSFPENNPAGLYLYANKHNSGRTALLWWLFITLAEMGKLPQGGLLHTNSMLLKDMQGDGFEQTTMRYAMHCSILLLDDFGLERFTDAMRSNFADIIEHRNWNKKPTIVTSLVHCASWAWPEGPDQNLVSKLQKSCKEVTIDCEEAPL